MLLIFVSQLMYVRAALPPLRVSQLMYDEELRSGKHMCPADTTPQHAPVLRTLTGGQCMHDHSWEFLQHTNGMHQMFPACSRCCSSQAIPASCAVDQQHNIFK